MTGLGNYSRLVIERVAMENPADRLFVYTPSLRDNPRLETVRGFHNVEFRLPPPRVSKGLCGVRSVLSTIFPLTRWMCFMVSAMNCR